MSVDRSGILLPSLLSSAAALCYAQTDTREQKQSAKKHSNKRAEATREQEQERATGEKRARSDKRLSAEGWPLGRVARHKRNRKESFAHAVEMEDNRVEWKNNGENEIMHSEKFCSLQRELRCERMERAGWEEVIAMAGAGVCALRVPRTA